LGYKKPMDASCWRCGSSPNNIYWDDKVLRCFVCGFSQNRERELEIQNLKDSLPDIIRRTSWGEYALKKRLKKKLEKNK